MRLCITVCLHQHTATVYMLCSRQNDNDTTLDCFCVSLLQTYLAASQRCHLSDAASGYWSLHIKEDERHGRQMVDEVAVPLVDM